MRLSDFFFLLLVGGVALMFVRSQVIKFEKFLSDRVSESEKTFSKHLR